MSRIDSHGRARRKADPSAQDEDRIEHRSGGARQQAAVDRRGRRSNAEPPAEEAGAVRLELRLSDALARRDGVMRGPDFGLIGERRRRVARMAPRRGTYSVSTNNLEKTGWAVSAACGAMTISA